MNLEILDSSYNEWVRVLARFRLTSPDIFAGAARLFVLIDDGGSRGSPAVVLSARVGDLELAVATLSLPFGPGVLLRVDGSRGALEQGSEMSAADPIDLSPEARLLGISVGEIGPAAVAEGSVQMRLVGDIETPIRVNTLVRKVDSIDAPVVPSGGTDAWVTEVALQPAALFQVLIRFENVSSGTLGNLIAACNLPNNCILKPNTTRIFNGNYPQGLNGRTDNVSTGGINIGDYARRASGYVTFTLQVADKNRFAHVGEYALTVVGIIKADGTNEIYNTARVSVEVT